jgi:hypothetical protein
MGHALVSQRLRIQRGNTLHPLDELMVGGVQAVFLLLLVFVAVFAGLARRLKGPQVSCCEKLWCIWLASVRRTVNQSAMFGELIASYQRRLDAMPAEREEQVKGLADQTPSE